MNLFVKYDLFKEKKKVFVILYDFYLKQDGIFDIITYFIRVT